MFSSFFILSYCHFQIPYSFLHDALPISQRPYFLDYVEHVCTDFIEIHGDRKFGDDAAIVGGFGMLRNIPVCVIDRKSTRLNSSHLGISYAVFCLKKKVWITI